jgi:transcriptional regulator with XRE-family HTH domain
MTKLADRIKSLLDSAKGSHRFKLERAILKFTEQLSVRMGEMEMGPSALAQKIGVKPPYISKILRGTSNFTLDTIIKMASAVNCDFVFDLVPRDSVKEWSTSSLREFRTTASSNPQPAHNRLGKSYGPYESIGVFDKHFVS